MSSPSRGETIGSNVHMERLEKRRKKERGKQHSDSEVAMIGEGREKVSKERTIDPLVDNHVGMPGLIRRDSSSDYKGPTSERRSSRGSDSAEKEKGKLKRESNGSDTVEKRRDSLVDVPKERKYSDGERPSSRNERRATLPSPMETYFDGEGKNTGILGDEEGEEHFKGDNMPSSLEKLAMIRKEEEKLRMQKDLMKRELKRQKTLKKDRRDSRRLPRDVVGSYPDSEKELEDLLSEDEKEDSKELGDQDRLSDRGDLAVARQRLKFEKEKLKKQEEQLRKEKDILERQAKEEVKRIKREKEDMWRKTKEDMKFEEKQKMRRSIDADGASPMMAGWVKMRGPLKNWHLRYLVLRPGKLIYYKDMMCKDYQGIITLAGCKVTERSTKKGGYCFKIFHPLEATIYASKGLKGETIKSGLVPLSADHAILRVTEEVERAKWIAAIDLAIDQEGNRKPDMGNISTDKEEEEISETSPATNLQLTKKKKHASNTTETEYLPDFSLIENADGTGAQEEVLGNESKNLLYALVRQVRPGMDLSRIPLPTFILEPRSMLDKFSDYLSHSELLALVPKINDPFERIVALLKWYLSGFYMKPKGVKKPYNSILGETFRCMWKMHDNTKTFYIAEQVSHHPPVSAFYASNRKAGFVANGSILFRSKFFGTSVASLLDGFVTVYILPFDEEYEVTFPSPYAKGFLFGTLLMEYGGHCTVNCRKTGYRAEIEFKLKPMFGGEYNVVGAKIKRDQQTVAVVSGKWDGKVDIKYVGSEKTEELWSPSPEVRKNKMPRYKPPMQKMLPLESERLWQHVTDAIIKGDQQRATDEKYKIEDAQRQITKEREARGIIWKPRLFVQHNGIWTYKYLNTSIWDNEEELEEEETNFVIRSRKLADTSSSASEEDDIHEEEGVAEPFHGADSSDIEPQGEQRSRSSSLASSSDSAFQRKLEQRIFKLEKDLLLLHHKIPEQRNQSLFERRPWLILFLAIFLNYLFSKLL